MKKLIAFGGATLALLVFAVPALAYMPNFQMPNVDSVKITSQTVATANTGDNTQASQTTVIDSFGVSSLSTSTLNYQRIDTGDAYANARSLTVANADPCGCGMTYCSGCRGSQPTELKTVEVGEYTAAVADSGANQQLQVRDVLKSGGVVIKDLNMLSGGTIVTGNAGANASSRTLVNVQPVRWGR